MRKQLTLMAVCMACLFLQAAAQNKISFENVRQVYIRNSGQIMDGEELKGYFSFYVTDKKDRKTNAYMIQILDNNLNKVKEIEFEDDKNIQILESSYNNSAIMFLFYNRKEKTLEYRTYGFDGKVKSTYTKDLTNRTMMLIEHTYATGGKSEEGQNETIFSVGNVGFTTVIPVKEGKYYSYEVNFFFTDRNKQWTYEAAEEQEDKWCTALYLGATDSLVVYEVIKQKRLMSREAHSWLIAFNIFTGKKQFEVSTEAEDYKFFPMNIVTLKGQSEFMLLGTYYDPEGRVAKDASLGLASWRYNTAGKVMSKKYNSWEGPISKFLPADAKGRVADVGYIYFHKVLQTEDGKFFAVGEGYKKVVSGLGVAAGILNGMSGSSNGISMMKLKITDLIVMQFDEQFNISNAKVYEKNSNSVEMPAGASYLTPHTMALIAKSFKAFDYDFTQTDKNHTRFSVGYSDYVKEDGFKGLTFNTISYADAKLTTDKINISSNKATWMRLMAAKPGFIVIMEYFKKEKKLDVRLEKLN